MMLMIAYLGNSTMKNHFTLKTFLTLCLLLILSSCSGTKTLTDEGFRLYYPDSYTLVPSNDKMESSEIPPSWLTHTFYQLEKDEAQVVNIWLITTDDPDALSAIQNLIVQFESLPAQPTILREPTIVSDENGRSIATAELSLPMQMQILADVIAEDYIHTDIKAIEYEDRVGLLVSRSFEHNQQAQAVSHRLIQSFQAEE